LTSEQQSLSEVKDDSDTSAIQGYEEVALSEVVDPVLGKTPRRKNDDYWQGDVKWASAKDISQNSTRRIYDTAEYMTAEGKDASNAKIMPEGTLVVIARGSLGLSAQLGKPMTFNQSCYGLDADNDKLLDDFLYYVWQYRFNQIQSVSHGTVFDTITMDSFKDIDIPLPSLETQKRICNVLTSIDDKIEVNNRIDEILEEMAQTIFRSWFIEFDQYGGEVEYDEDFERDVPVSWEKSSLDTIADFLNGMAWQDYSSESDGENDLPVVKIKELRNGITKDSDRVNRSESPEKYILDDGDIVFSWSASLVLDLWSEGEAFLNQHLFKVTSQEYPRWFCYLWIDHHIRIFRHIAEAKKTTMGHIKRSDLEKAKVLVPSAEDFKEISEEMKPIFEKRVESMIENRRLEELRDTLLPKLMSGEIRVNDIELDESDDDSEV